MAIVTCQHCGRPFSIRPARIAAGRGRYCSRACQGAARARQRVSVCAFCGVTFEDGRARRRFCSRECASLAAAQRVGVRERRCATCGGAFAPASPHDRYCSVACEAAGVMAAGGGRLFDDPWASGAIPPDRYGRDLYRMPDLVLGF